MSTTGYKPRAKVDRRRVEGPHEKFAPDRRRMPERRRIQVTEATFSEWVAWMVKLQHARNRRRATQEIAA